MRFLVLCDHYGSQHLAVKLVASGRNTGVPGLPETDDWTAWDADRPPRSRTTRARGPSRALRQRELFGAADYPVQRDDAAERAGDDGGIGLRLPARLVAG